MSAATLPTARRFIGVAPCGRVIIATHGLFPWIEKVCPDHRQEVVRLKPIRGRLGVRACDARCSSARTKDCECQCAGANHGRDFEWAEAPERAL